VGGMVNRRWSHREVAPKFSHTVTSLSFWEVQHTNSREIVWECEHRVSIVWECGRRAGVCASCGSVNIVRECEHRVGV